MLKRYRLGSETPLEVSQYIGFLNEILKRVKARVIGEVSGVKIDTNGHVWFSLKDKKNGNTLPSVIWRYNYQLCGVTIKEGLEIIATGSSDLYPASGRFTFKVDTVELVGEGALKKAYDELKKRLDEEGIFAQERKRPIPNYPQKIGVVTSLRSGTVIHDFTSNLGKFGFKIKAIDSRVEGQGAVKEILSAIKSFKKIKIDLLVIIRGGGSLESLMAFDNETLVREVASFPVPVIAGIGHHKDITLVSLAADASESTPTAAAQLLNSSWEKARYRLDVTEKSVLKDFESILFLSKERVFLSTDTVKRQFDLIFKRYREVESKIVKNLSRVHYLLTDLKRIIFEKSSLIFKEFIELIQMRKQKEVNQSTEILSHFSFLKKEELNLLERTERIISAHNPEHQLDLGYSVVFFDNRPIKSVKGLKEGDRLDLKVSDGSIESEINKIIKKDE